MYWGGGDSYGSKEKANGEKEDVLFFPEHICMSHWDIFNKINKRNWKIPQPFCDTADSLR